MLRHIRMNKSGAAVISPRPAKINGAGCHLCTGGQPAVQEHIARFARFRGRSGDITRADTPDLVVLEDGGGIAEDEIDRTFDEAVHEIRPALICEQSILMAKKLDIAVNSAIPLGIQRHSLPGIPSGTVFYRHIFQGEIRSRRPQGIAPAGAQFLTVCTQRLGRIAVHQHCAFPAAADDAKMLFACRHQHLFPVNPVHHLNNSG
ncbi:hypothetical protein D3C73_693280 [compost metagenome]